MGCGSSTQPKAIALLNSPLASKTLLEGPVSPNKSAKPPREQPVPIVIVAPVQDAEATPVIVKAYAPRMQAQRQQYLTSLQKALSSPKGPTVDINTSSIEETVQKPADAPRSYAPRHQAQHQGYLTSLERSLGARQRQPVPAASIEQATSSDKNTQDAPKAYEPRLQARQQQYLTALQHASAAPATSTSTPAYTTQKSQDAPKSYAPRLQEKHAQYLTSLQQAHQVQRTTHQVQMSGPEKGDQAAVANGLATAAEAIAASNPRVAAGLVVMAAALSEAMPKALTSKAHASMAVGLASAASDAAAANSAAAPGLVIAAASVARAVAEPP